MATRAQIRPGYRNRFLIISVAMLLPMLWFLFDGLVTYPPQVRLYERFLEIQQTYPNNWGEQWRIEARARGLDSYDVPEERTQQDVVTQFICAAVAGVGALAFGVIYLRLGKRWVASDVDGLRTSQGDFAPWDSIVSVDKSRWQTKGIAVVRYRDAASDTVKRITLDDWKYYREPTAQVMVETEHHLRERNPDALPPQSRTAPGASPPRETDAEADTDTDTDAEKHTGASA